MSARKRFEIEPRASHRAVAREVIAWCGRLGSLASFSDCPCIGTGFPWAFSSGAGIHIPTPKYFPAIDRSPKAWREILHFAAIHENE
jgi:hypothetical protein